MKKITIVLILFALVLTACEALGISPKEGTDVKVEKITPSPDKAAMEFEAEPMIVFERGGGIAGVTEQWSIYASGKISSQNGEELTVAPAQVTALLDAIQAAGFYDMKVGPGAASPGTCKDCFTYKLTVNKDEKPYSITAQEGAKGVPDMFWNLINQINDLVTKAKQ
jgi:hypothetical protein